MKKSMEELHRELSERIKGVTLNPFADTPRVESPPPVIPQEGNSAQKMEFISTTRKTTTKTCSGCRRKRNAQ